MLHFHIFGIGGVYSISSDGFFNSFIIAFALSGSFSLLIGHFQSPVCHCLNNKYKNLLFTSVRLAQETVIARKTDSQKDEENF